jgi:hypothetical protein
VRKDRALAITWYIKAAEQGEGLAQLYLGFCYAKGLGAARDYEQAAMWYRKAAEKGYVYAQYSLGLRYYNGEGVTKDYVQAIEWIRKAADQGLAQAQFKLADSYHYGRGITKDEIKAYAYYKLSGLTNELVINKLGILEKKLSQEDLGRAEELKVLIKEQLVRHLRNVPKTSELENPESK